MLLQVACLAALLGQIAADSELDATRTGSYYTDFPIYRSGSGTNVVKVVIGTPGVEAQLALSTNVNFIQIASSLCSGCTSEDISQDQVNIAVYPQVPEDTLTFTSRLGRDTVLDSRGQDQVAYPVSAVDKIESGRDGQGGGAGRDVSLGRGVSGFYGLGINQLSLVANMLNAENYLPNQPVPTNFIVGFDIGGYVNQAGVRVGSMHWGAVPQGKWVGDLALDEMPKIPADGAIYYSPNQQYLALAGKPGSVNDFNVSAQGGGGMPDRKLAGILIGTLFGALLVLFIICYSRNRSTFQSVWARGARQMQRAQMNAVIRQTTIPPPMMGVPGPMMGGPMMGGPMMGMGYPGAMPPGMGPMGVGPMGMGPMGMPRMGYPGPIGQMQYPQQPPPQLYPSQHAAMIPPPQSRAEQQQPLLAQPLRHSLPASPQHRDEYSPRRHFDSSEEPVPGRRFRDRHSTPPPARRTEAWQPRQEGHAAPRQSSKDQHPHLTTSPPSATLNASYLPQSQPLYNPQSSQQHAGHRFSRPAYDHAPPGSATSKSIWHFGKPRSVSRGYEAAPRHASASFEQGDGNAPARQSGTGWFRRGGGNAKRGRGGPDAGAEADMVGERGGDWTSVERNREQEGLSAAKAWR